MARKIDPMLERARQQSKGASNGSANAVGLVGLLAALALLVFAAVQSQA